MARSPKPDLPVIPQHRLDRGWPAELLRREPERTAWLLEFAERHYPPRALAVADAVCRRWLRRSGSPYADEIAAVAETLGRPGAYALNLNYEWGCSCRVTADGNDGANRLIRLLDWPYDGLGRAVVLIDTDGPGGRWLSAGWPGFAGVIQGTAPGRFAVALNQPPVGRVTGLFSLDWSLERLRVLARPAMPPAHLLRQTLEVATDYEAAKAMLRDTPIALPVIYILAGTKPGQGCVIERRPNDARVQEGAAVAATNHWQAADWAGPTRNHTSRERLTAITAAATDSAFTWLVAPLLNRMTRLVMLAEPARGRLVLQGFEQEAPATEVLQLVLDDSRLPGMRQAAT